MARIQNGPVHMHQSAGKKDLNLVSAPADSQIEIRSKAKQVNVGRGAGAASGKPDELTVAGFSLQFIVIMAVIIFGVLVLVVRLALGF